MRQAGQIVLITLLVLTIATTVALSLISRTTTDTAITAQIEESSRAFSAAEAGIEEALKTGVGTGGVRTLSGGDASYEVTVNTIGGTAGLYEFPKKTQQGITETIWLVDHDASGQLVLTPTYTSPDITVCWSGDSPDPAIVATLLYIESSNGSYRVAKIPFDSDATRATSNGFSTSVVLSGCSGSTDTDYRATITFNSVSASIDASTDTLIALRIRPVYNDAKLAVDTAGFVLPLQGKRIESTGSTTGGTNRKIVVYQQYRAPSTLFDAAIYSQGSLSK